MIKAITLKAGCLGLPWSRHSPWHGLQCGCARRNKLFSGPASMHRCPASRQLQPAPASAASTPTCYSPGAGAVCTAAGGPPRCCVAGTSWPGHRGSGRCRHTAGWVVNQQLHDIGRTPLLCCSTTAALVALATAAGSAGGHMARCDSAPSRLCTPTRTTPDRDVRRAVVRVFRPTRLQFWIRRCEALRITRTEIPLTRHACSLRPCSCTTDPLIKRPVPSSAALCHLVPSVTMGPAGKGALSILLLCCSNAFMTTGGLPRRDWRGA